MAGTVYVTVSEARQLGLSGRAFADTDAADFLANIQAASDEASSALANQYTLPIITYGFDIKSAVSRIAAYEFLSVRGLNPEAGGADKNVLDRAKDAREWLDLVAKGERTPTGIVDSTSGQAPGTPGFQPDPISSSQRGWTSRGCPPGTARGPFVGD